VLIVIEGKFVIKTKEMAQNEAALEHDNLKSEYEGRGFGEITTGKRGKYFGEYNYPAVINKGRAPGARVAQDYATNWVVHHQGAIAHSVAQLRASMRRTLQKAGIGVTNLNLPTAAWMNNHINTNEGCTYCSAELHFSSGSFGYQIDAIHPHARGGPGYTEANMAAV
jgi:hypothetical protein